MIYLIITIIVLLSMIFRKLKILFESFFYSMFSRVLDKKNRLIKNKINNKQVSIYAKGWAN